MSIPFYVSPEQLMKDRADFARQGIQRGRPVVIASCQEGIVMLSHNPSQSLHKLSEIYDRIGLAAVGRYNEFEALRQAGVRYADTRGYAYDRTDVRARGLVSLYAGILGESFISGPKPLEVELALAEVGHDPADDRIYQISFDGTLTEHDSFLVFGGQAQHIADQLLGLHDPTDTMPSVLEHLITALDAEPTELEAAILDRDSQTTRGSHRSFRRFPLPSTL